MKRISFALATLWLLSTVSLKLSAQEFSPIPHWLVAGSFSNQENGNVPVQPFIDETHITPDEGEKAGDALWTAVDQHAIDFLHAGFSKTINVMAYAFVYIYSKQDQLATLLLGSDDGAMVWLNGLPVWSKTVINRSMIENEDSIAIQLNKGYNRLLVKVEQAGGGWGLVCNLLSSFPVNTVISRPPINELAIASGLQVYDVSTFSNKGEAGIQVNVKNFNVNITGKTEIGIMNAGNKILAGKAIDTPSPGGKTSVILSFPVQQAAGILAQKDLRISLSNQNGKHQVYLPSSLATDLLMQLADDSTICSPETMKTARELKYAEQVYGLNEASVLGARKALLDVAGGWYDRLGAVYRSMLKDKLKNIPDLSKDTIQIIGHAHMDMNWLWTYPESEKMFHDNIRQAVALMEKYSDFTMLQSQATIYQYIKQVDPPLFEKVTKYVKEGRFEPVGGMWTEGDLNLTGGEALCRSFLLGQRFFYDNFGKTAHVGWLPDDFGHISQYPQILKLAGCNYYYFMRCNPYAGTFWWTGPDSSRVLCFSGIGYGNTITPAIKNEIDALSPEKHRILVPTGVGDHGGGPTLKDINMIHKLDSTPHYPAVKFTTAEEFFKVSASEMKNRPTHYGEMQFIFPGCYTSVAEIKENTRKSEQSLYRAEYVSSLRWLFGEPYPASELKSLWETVAFNQFHDILPGSAIYETYRDAVADHKMVQKTSREIFEQGFRHLADEIKFKPGMGQPVVVLNMQPRDGKVLAEAEVFSYSSPVTASLTHWSDFNGSDVVIPTDGISATVLVRDDSGKVYPAQITGGKVSPPGYRTRIQFVIDDMPAGGYKTFYADVSRPGIETEPVPVEKGTFETDYFTVGFDMKTGDIIRLKDKRTGKEYVGNNGRLNKLTMFMEAPNGMNAWDIGKIDDVQDISDVESVNIVENGPVRATVEVVKKWGNSKFIQKTYIYKSYPRIDFDLDAHWFETGDGEHDAPFLRATFDLNIDHPVFENQVPFDVVERPVNGQEVPAQEWVDVTDDTDGIALLNRTKFGHSFENGQLRLSLLRATYYPDEYPNIGINHIQYSLYPHSGDWKNGVWEEADRFNIPVYAAEPPSLSLVKTHATRPPEDSFMSVSPASVILSGIKQGEGGNNLIIRLAEVCGKETTATVKLPVTITKADRVNIIEFPQDSANKPAVDGKTVRVKLKPHEIVTLSLTTERER